MQIKNGKGVDREKLILFSLLSTHPYKAHSGASGLLLVLSWLVHLKIVFFILQWFLPLLI